MFTKYSVLRLFFALFIILMISSTTSASPLKAPNGTSFTYQGKLIDGGSPANGVYDLQFKLYDALSGGAQVGSTLTQSSMTVTNGLFTVQLDFGNVFNGTALYLEIGVRPGGSSGGYTTLTPRQPLSPTPYALYTTQSGNTGMLNTQPASYYLNASNINSGALGTNYFSAYADLVAEGYLGNAASDLALNNGTLQSTLNADLLDGLHAISFALAGHTHWGETWSGSGTGLTLSGGSTGISGNGSTYGLYGQSDSTSGYGVYGSSSAISGTTYGLYGRSQSTSGYGVWGSSVASSGNTIGVVGATNSSSGMGVFGYNASISGVTYGVSGQSYSNSGRGMYGYASATSGTTYGVYGQSDSTAGRGVYGEASATSGTTYGMYGQSDSTTGKGVYGEASATSGTTSGVYGQVDSTAGSGVRGYASATSGSTYGVYGQSASTLGGTGVYGLGFIGVGGNGTGANSTGVAGISGSGGTGVYGSGGAYAGYFAGNVEVDGDVNVYGAFYVHGSPKSAVVDTKDYGTRTLYAVESPENWFQDFGTGQLTNGSAIITIDPVFAETVNLATDYHVFFTPMGDCALYVSDKTPTSFTVKALGGQTCSIAFDYNIIAKRLGYETVRLAVANPSPTTGKPNGGTP